MFADDSSALPGCETGSEIRYVLSTPVFELPPSSPKQPWMSGTRVHLRKGPHRRFDFRVAAGIRRREDTKRIWRRRRRPRDSCFIRGSFSLQTAQNLPAMTLTSCLALCSLPQRRTRPRQQPLKQLLCHDKMRRRGNQQTRSERRQHQLRSQRPPPAARHILPARAPKSRVTNPTSPRMYPGRRGDPAALPLLPPPPHPLLHLLRLLLPPNLRLEHRKLPLLSVRR